jgi:outer membrane lipoprotein-sorting protein
MTNAVRFRLTAVVVLLMGLALSPFGAVRAESAEELVAQFAQAVGAIDDYTVSIATHETSGTDVQDRGYHYFFKKPALAKIETVSGPGHGSAAVWHGGDTVRGHQGGFFAGIKLTIGIHDGRAVSLRGDTIDSASFPAQLEHFRTTKGELSEAAGPAIGGVATEALTLKPADPAANRNVSRDVLFLSNANHLPVRRERFEGDTLVKQEDFTNLKLNVGLKDDDFSL